MGKETSSPSNLKKKRKITTEGNTEMDIYKRVVEYENKESMNRDSTIDAKIFSVNCHDLRRLLEEVEAQKLGGTLNKTTAKDTLMEIYLKISILKKLNRIDKIKHVFGKETLNNEKQKCDSIKLSYQNLVYELQNIIADKNKCLSFKSKDEEIELVPLEEFLQNAPITTTSPFINENEYSEEQQHSLRLARLEWELMERKNLAQLCKTLVKEQKKMEKDLVEIKEKLNVLKPLLLNVIETTKPVQEHLDISSSTMRVEHKLAHLLPDPLYILYVNAAAYKVVHALNLTVDILGDEEDAVRYNELSSENASISEEDSEDLELPEVEEVVEVKKRRHRKSVHQPVDPMEEKKKKLLETHPLYVELRAKLENGPEVIINFKFCTKLKLTTITSKVCVPGNIIGITALEVLSSESVLSELFEGDCGTESPNPLTLYQLKKVGVNSYELLVQNIGYAYQWVQRVCGVDFINKKVNSEHTASITIEKVIKILYKRLETRYDLAKQLNDLDQKNLSKCPTPFFSNPISSITKWNWCTYQKYCQAEFTQGLLEEELVMPKDHFYALNLERGNACMQAFVVIKSNYPEVRPIFSISISSKDKSYHSANCDDLRDMERLLSSWEVKSKNMSYILSSQITYLSFMFDVFLETTDSNSFSQNATFIKKICARNRRKPFVFHNTGTGIFTQY